MSEKMLKVIEITLEAMKCEEQFIFHPNSANDVAAFMVTIGEALDDVEKGMTAQEGRDKYLELNRAKPKAS